MTLKEILRFYVAPVYRRLVCVSAGQFDRLYLNPDVPSSPIVDIDEEMVKFGNQPNKRVLEIGSREVTGKSTSRATFDKATYIGFDYHPGPNVDVCGDAHKLSRYFSEDEKFDVIFSSAVFEHLAMPWVVAGEIRKLLKVGGLIVVRTHFSYGAHERPWNFFQFSDMGLRALFPPSAGFECLDAVMRNPMVGRFSAMADSALRGRPITSLYCSSDFIGRKVQEVLDFDWSTVDTASVVGNTHYPEPGQ